MTAADKYADELYEMSRHITSTPESITLMRARDELRRLAPMEAQNLKLMDDYFGAKARIKELEDALRFYADKANYIYSRYDDGGVIARKALGETK